MAMNRRQRARASAAVTAANRLGREPLPSHSAITLDIGGVVLHGIDIQDRNGLAAALEGELAAVLAEADVTPALHGGGRDRVDGGVISLEENHSSPAVGRQIAHAVQRSLIGFARRSPGKGLETLNDGTATTECQPSCGPPGTDFPAASTQVRLRRCARFERQVPRVPAKSLASPWRECTRAGAGKCTRCTPSHRSIAQRGRPKIFLIPLRARLLPCADPRR